MVRAMDCEIVKCAYTSLLLSRGPKLHFDAAEYHRFRTNGQRRRPHLRHGRLMLPGVDCNRSREDLWELEYPVSSFF